MTQLASLARCHPPYPTSRALILNNKNNNDITIITTILSHSSPARVPVSQFRLAVLGSYIPIRRPTLLFPSSANTLTGPVANFGRVVHATLIRPPWVWTSPLLHWLTVFIPVSSGYGCPTVLVCGPSALTVIANGLCRPADVFALSAFTRTRVPLLPASVDSDAGLFTQ